VLITAFHELIHGQLLLSSLIHSKNIHKSMNFRKMMVTLSERMKKY